MILFEEINNPVSKDEGTTTRGLPSPSGSNLQRSMNDGHISPFESSGLHIDLAPAPNPAPGSADILGFLALKHRIVSWEEPALRSFRQPCGGQLPVIAVFIPPTTGNNRNKFRRHFYIPALKIAFIIPIELGHSHRFCCELETMIPHSRR